MKKVFTVLSIIAALVAAYIVLFPQNNPLKKLFAPKSPASPLSPGDIISPTEAEKNRGTVQPKATDNSQYRLGFPLSKGSRGSYVSAIQEALNRKFYTSLVVDGIFGSKTYRALSTSGFNPDSVTYEDYKKIIA